MTQMVKGPQVRCAKTFIRAIAGMKGDTIREVVQQPITWAYLRVEWTGAFCKIE